MQKWEYLYVTLGFQMTKNYQYVIDRVDGRTLKIKPTPTEFFNRLGSDGWELAGVDNGGYVFKRPKL